MPRVNKTLVAVVFLLAYLAILLKLLVFKYPGIHFDPEYNFIPFKTILPYLTGYPNWIVARDNLLGNIILFLPLGMLLPFLYRQANWKYALAAGFVVSLSIEVLQIILHKGTFDVDDMLLNTLGVFVGYILLKVIHRWVLLLPEKQI